MKKIGIGGGTVTTLASNQNSPDGITSDGVHVFWTVGGDPSAIYSVPVGTGTVNPVVAGQHAPLSVASDGVNIYWAEYSPTAVNHVSSTPDRRREPQHPGDLDRRQRRLLVVVSTTTVYWAENGGTTHQIKRVAKTGGAVTVMESGNLQANWLVQDTNYLYWVTTDGTVRRIHK